jgi:hypothetical protein
VRNPGEVSLTKVKKRWRRGGDTSDFIKIAGVA